MSASRRCFSDAQFSPLRMNEPRMNEPSMPMPQSIAPTAECALEGRLNSCQPQQPADAPFLPVQLCRREIGYGVGAVRAEYHPGIIFPRVGGPRIAAGTGGLAGLGKADPA